MTQQSRIDSFLVGVIALLVLAWLLTGCAIVHVVDAVITVIPAIGDLVEDTKDQEVKP